ncbi:MAG TPA: CocE/NonD family hydrolase [Candidatus Acidoferrales bacterium]|nr:CocE/NonD family hydrolase [Candidatus Acidoferrales bacterium]
MQNRVQKEALVPFRVPRAVILLLTFVALLALAASVSLEAGPSTRQTSTALTQTAAAGGEVIIEHNVPARMRDGVILRADIYRPKADGKYPVLLTRTPYNKNGEMSLGVVAAQRGYVLIAQDTRGRYASEGEWYPFKHESNDGYDTIEWAASLPYSNGKIGMYGGSYVGATQYLAAIANPPHLAGIFPDITASNYHNGWTYQGGAFEQWFNESWTTGLAMNTLERRDDDAGNALAGTKVLPLNSYPILDPVSQAGLAPYFTDWLAHPNYDSYWKQWSIEAHYGAIHVPVYGSGAWYDIFLRGTLRNYMLLKTQAGSEAARRNQRLLIFVGGHAGGSSVSKVGGVDFGPKLPIDLNAVMFRWYDWILKGVDNGMAAEKPVRIFVMGKNDWRDEADWPLARAVSTHYYLHSEGRANSVRGDGTLSTTPPTVAENSEQHSDWQTSDLTKSDRQRSDLTKTERQTSELTKSGRQRSGPESSERQSSDYNSSDRFVYDPADPVPTIGGPLCCGALPTGIGPEDQRPAEDRSDVLVYSTPAFTKDTEVTGPVSLDLYVSTSAVDTDFTGKLVDVSPDGFARNLTEGILRLRYRDSEQTPELANPGQIYHITLDLVATSNVFLAGHKLRLEVSSSNFPRFDRNLNTGAVQALGSNFVKATNIVYHDRAHPSALIVPIVP